MSPGWGAIQGESSRLTFKERRERARLRGELKDRRNRSAEGISAATNLAVAPGERVGDHRPNGAVSRRSSTSSAAARRDQRPGPAQASASTASAVRVNRLGLAPSFQITNIFVRLSCSRTALRPCGHGLPYAFWNFLADLRDATARRHWSDAPGAKADKRWREPHLAEQRALEIASPSPVSPTSFARRAASGRSKSELDCFIRLIAGSPLARRADRRTNGRRVGLADKIAVLVTRDHRLRRAGELRPPARPGGRLGSVLSEQRSLPPAGLSPGREPCCN